MDLSSLKDLSKIKDLTNIDKNDVLRALGLETTSSNMANSLLPMLGVFAAGLLTGIGAGMLLAPTSGQKMREELAERADAARQQVSKKVSEHNPIS